MRLRSRLPNRAVAAPGPAPPGCPAWDLGPAPSRPPPLGFCMSTPLGWRPEGLGAEGLIEDVGR